MTTEQTLGPYRLVRELGRGGMGVVYEAEALASPGLPARGAAPRPRRRTSERRARPRDGRGQGTRLPRARPRRGRDAALAPSEEELARATARKTVETARPRVDTTKANATAAARAIDRARAARGTEDPVSVAIVGDLDALCRRADLVYERLAEARRLVPGIELPRELVAFLAGAAHACFSRRDVERGLALVDRAIGPARSSSSGARAAGAVRSPARRGRASSASSKKTWPAGPEPGYDSPPRDGEDG